MILSSMYSNVSLENVSIDFAGCDSRSIINTQSVTLEVTVNLLGDINLGINLPTHLDNLICDANVQVPEATVTAIFI